MEAKLGLFGSALLLAASAVTPVHSSEGAFHIEAMGATQIDCALTTPCKLETTLVATNVSGQTLYGVQAWTPFSDTRFAERYGLKFFSNGAWTTDQSMLQEEVKPGEKVVVQVDYSLFSQTPGKHTGTLYMDGSTCNNNFTPPDCIPYGGVSVTLVANRH